MASLRCRSHAVLTLAASLALIAPTTLFAQSETAGLPGLTPAADPISSTWKRVRSEHFTAVGDAGESQMRQALSELEGFHAALDGAADFLPDTRFPPVTPLLVMFRDEAGFATFRPRSTDGQRLRVGGYYHEGLDRAYMVLPGANGLEAVLHEYAHAVIRFNFGELPSWLTEGLAELYASAARSESRSPGRFLGRPVPSRVQDVVSRSYPTVAELISRESLWESVDRRTSLQYSKSWALVHYLLLGRASVRRPGEIDRYRRALAAGFSQADAFLDAFDMTPEAADRQLDAYVRLVQLPMVKLPDAARATAVESTRMRQSEIESVQGNLLVAVRNLVEGERRLLRALGRDPASVAARIGLAKHRLLTERPADAVDILQPAVAQDPLNGPAWFYLGRGLRMTGYYGEAYAAFQQVLQLGAPASVLALAWFESSLCAFALNQGDEGRAAMALVQSLDASPTWYYTRALALWEMGRDADVITDVAAFIRFDQSGGADRSHAAFLGALSARRLGSEDLAGSFLMAAEPSAAPVAWETHVLAYLRGAMSDDDLLSRAVGIGQQTEARAYLGIAASLGGRLDDAFSHLRWVRDHGARTAIEYRYAVAELARLEAQAAGVR